MPIRDQNLVGKVFGHLTVVKKSSKRGHEGEYLWVCQCDCGKTSLVSTGSLNSGHITSCGHVKLKNLKPSEKRHNSQMSDKLPKNNKTGYRNISRFFRNGRWRYRVAVMYEHKQHSKNADSLEEALGIREELRKKYWPNYKK